MGNQKRINPFWAFIAAILGWRLLKHFDFKTFTFADPYFDIVYIIVFGVAIFFIIKDYKSEK